MGAIMKELWEDGREEEAQACREQIKSVSEARSEAAEQELREARVRRRYALRQ